MRKKMELKIIRQFFISIGKNKRFFSIFIFPPRTNVDGDIWYTLLFQANKAFIPPFPFSITFDLTLKKKNDFINASKQLRDFFF